MLDADELKRQYHAVSRETHPDANRTETGSQSDSAETNAAYQCLLQPSTRLRHLLVLIAPGEVTKLKGGQIPDTYIDIFSRIANAVQGADQMIARKKGATSALAQALLAADEMEAREALEDAGALLADQRAAIESENLPAIDALLASEQVDQSVIVEKISESYRALGFLDKWQAQVRAKLLELFEA